MEELINNVNKKTLKMFHNYSKVLPKNHLRIRTFFQTDISRNLVSSSNKTPNQTRKLINKYGKNKNTIISLSKD